MKPKVYTQLYCQMIFAVKHRDRLLRKEFREDVFKYISTTASNMKHKSIIVNGVSDHIHIFLGLNPNVSISDTVWEIKRSSSLFINNKNWLKNKFNWQDGYGAFSYARSQVGRVYNYIENQESHHKRKTFKDEYTTFLKKFQIEYEDKYLFEFFD